MKEQKYEYNRIVIVGNGFDRAIGQETSYHSFLTESLRKLLLKFSVDQKNYLDSVFSLRTDHWPLPRHEQFQKNVSGANSFSQIIDISKKHFLSISGANEYGERLISNIENKGWVDIEQEYFNSIWEIYENQDGKISEYQVEQAKRINKTLEALTSELCNYLAELQEKFDHTSIRMPMIEFVERVFKPMSTSEFELTHKRQIDYKPPAKTLVVNFNYTNFFKKAIADVSYYKNGPSCEYDLVHIHGQIDHPKSIIFGYGDDTSSLYQELEDLNEDDFIAKFKSFRYPDGPIYKGILNTIESKSFEVYVVGHSCGLSDKNLLNEIFESENCIGIKICYREGEEGDSNDHFEKRLAISRCFNDKKKLPGKIIHPTPFDIIPQV